MLVDRYGREIKREPVGIVEETIAARSEQIEKGVREMSLRFTEAIFSDDSRIRELRESILGADAIPSCTGWHTLSVEPETYSQ